MPTRQRRKEIFNTPELICTSSRKPHNMSLEYNNEGDSLINRKNFLSQLGIDYKSLVCARQVHQANVYYAKEEDSGRGAVDLNTAIGATDALFTDIESLPLAVFTADCPPVFLYDALRPAVAIIHAGWRSIKQGIIQETILSMQKKIACDPTELVAGIGPAIRECCYEVGEEFFEYFPGFIIKRKNILYCNLAAVIISKLLEAGVKRDSISDSKICTSCRNNDFFSFRKEKNSCGRMMSLIMLR